LFFGGFEVLIRRFVWSFPPSAPNTFLIKDTFFYAPLTLQTFFGRQVSFPVLAQDSPCPRFPSAFRKIVQNLLWVQLSPMSGESLQALNAFITQIFGQSFVYLLIAWGSPVCFWFIWSFVHSPSFFFFSPLRPLYFCCCLTHLRLNPPPIRTPPAATVGGPLSKPCLQHLFLCLTSASVEVPFDRP